MLSDETMHLNKRKKERKMKKYIAFILLILLCIFVDVLIINGQTQITNEQIKAFRSLKTVRVVEDSGLYDGVIDFIQEHLRREQMDRRQYVGNLWSGQYLKNNTFRDMVMKLFTYTGIRIAETGTKDFDATLKIHGSLRLSNRHINGFFFNYDRAILIGSFSLEIAGVPPYMKPFSGDCEGKGLFSTPFDRVFVESFLPAIVETIGEVYGPNALIAALKDTDSSIRGNAEVMLRKMTGQNLGGDPAKWQEWWEKNKGK